VRRIKNRYLYLQADCDTKKPLPCLLGVAIDPVKLYVLIEFQIKNGNGALVKLSSEMDRVT
jgi:hypothetical protein